MSTTTEQATVRRPSPLHTECGRCATIGNWNAHDANLLQCGSCGNIQTVRRWFARCRVGVRSPRVTNVTTEFKRTA